MNAVVNLAPTRFGAAIATPLVENDRIKQLSDNDIKPFYQQQAKLAVKLLKEALGDYPLMIHKPEGAIFFWLWFKDLPSYMSVLKKKARSSYQVSSSSLVSMSATISTRTNVFA